MRIARGCVAGVVGTVSWITKRGAKRGAKRSVVRYYLIMRYRYRRVWRKMPVWVLEGDASRHLYEPEYEPEEDYLAILLEQEEAQNHSQHMQELQNWEENISKIAQNNLIAKNSNIGSDADVWPSQLWPPQLCTMNTTNFNQRSAHGFDDMIHATMKGLNAPPAEDVMTVSERTPEKAAAYRLNEAKRPRDEEPTTPTPEKAAAYRLNEAKRPSDEEPTTPTPTTEKNWAFPEKKKFPSKCSSCRMTYKKGEKNIILFYKKKTYCHDCWGVKKRHLKG